MGSPDVTIIVPMWNERDHARECVQSLLDQDYEAVREILVVDGGSTDGTREIVESFGGTVRLIDNPRRITAAAMNIGIRECTTDLFVRVDAHSTYARNYVSQSVKTMLETGASVVGGPMRPVGSTPFGRAVAAVTTSVFGVGPGKFHFGARMEEVDTVYLGMFRRDEVVALGGFDEDNFRRAGEDHELNFRITKAGGRIILDPDIHSTYIPRSNPRSLARQYFNYGMCKVITLRKHRALPSWRPLAPAGMVLAMVVWAVVALAAGWWSLALVPPCAYVVAVTVLGLRFERRDGVLWFDAARALAICHWAYGLGFWRGVAGLATLRPIQRLSGS